MATAATAKELDIKQGSMLLEINGINVDHMTCN
jgi:hypothetical protein